MKRTLHFNLAQAIKLMLIFLMCLPVWGTAVQAQTKEAYAVFDEATGTLFFKYDAAKPKDAYDVDKYITLPGWYGKCDEIKKIVIEPSFADARPTNCSYWFSDCNKVNEIEGIEYLNTSEVTSMEGMFSGCIRLKKLNVSKFNTEKVTTFVSMFGHCYSLSSLDVSSFNTENATNMSHMFSCLGLTSLDLSNFNTSNVTDMTYMFDQCRKLTSLNISNFNTFSVTDMLGMFNDCNKLKSLDVSNFNTSNVISMSRMFSGCRELISLNLSNFNTLSVTDMREMFANCWVLKSLDVSSFKTPNVTTMRSMFEGCGQLTSLDLSSFDTEKVEDMTCMFSLCEQLKTIYVSDKFVTTNVTITGSSLMFSSCKALEGAIKFDKNKVEKEWANYTDGYFTYKEPTSIKPLIDSSNEKPQYFDLQGKRLGKMQRGVNIVKRGGKTVKVVK